MKTKFFLTLFALNGLLLIAGNASAATVSARDNNHNISSLSHTIAELTDLDPGSHNLIESAIHRALIAKSIPDSARSELSYTDQHRINGVIIKPNPPIIHGIIIKPKPPIIHGVIIKPNPPIIHGVIIKP